jgi:hypothetical protein
MNQQQRNAKRIKRERRQTKENSWYCAGCKKRHPLDSRCPIPRLQARTNRLPI